MASLRFRFIILFAFGVFFMLSPMARSNGVPTNSNPDTIKQLLDAKEDEKAVELLLKNSESNIRINIKKASEYARRAVDIALKNRNYAQVAQGRLLLAKAYSLAGNYKHAIELVDSTNKYFKSQHDSLGIASAYHLLGQIYTRIGEFKKAMDNVQEAMALYNLLKNQEKIAEMYKETGNIYFYFGESAIALDFYQKSLLLSQQLKDKEGIAKTSNNMGRLYSELGDYKLALEYLNKSLSYKGNEEDEVSHANTLLNIGTVYQKMGDYQQSLKYFEQSKKLYLSVGYSEGIANSLFNLGKTYFQLKRFNQALAMYEEARAIAKRTDSNRILLLISKEMAETFSTLGDYRRSYQFFKEYDELREIVHREDKGKLLLEFEARYQIDAKQKEIELLSKEKELSVSEKKKVKILFAFAAILVLFLMSLIYFVYSRFRFKSKINRELVKEINHRKKVEATLQEYQDDLEVLVVERTRELNAAKEKAEESDKLKTAFLANMSHEIRTPMNAIVGFSYLLTDPELTDDLKFDYVKIIKSNGEVLMNLINDILDISMIESGQLKTKRKPCAVTNLLDELKPFYDKEKERYKKQHLEIIQDYEKGMENLIINTDKIRFRQVMTNLLSNAIKFTDKGSIAYGYRVADSEKVMFFVRDTGKGIPTDKHHVIFDRFSKFGDVNETKLYSGTGLGLAICHELVNLLGGKIWLDSCPGRGSTFYFTFPYDLSNDESLFLKQKGISFDIEKFKGKTILIAEDVLSNYQLLCAFLDKLNINIIWAQNGLEAVNIYKSNRNIDLILMDVQMPMMDGIKALEKIRKLDSNVPIIIITAFYLADEMERSYSAGCSDYIVKPMRKEDLLNIIYRYFD